MVPEESDILIIREEEEGERLDKILARRFTEVYSRSYFEYLIEEHLVLLNGIPVKKRAKLKAGDEVEVEFAAIPEANLSPENIPLTILYEDDHLLAINKPVGMVVHPAPGNWSGTFVNALLYHCQELSASSDSIRPGIVHRLDKDTSGVLLAAKTMWMQQKLIELFASRQVYKEYLAICVGNPGKGEIEAPIGRHPVHRKQMAVVPNGKQARTLYQTVGWNDKLSIVKVHIITGRTHQVRVHLRHRGTPILGDEVYGQAQANAHYKVTHQLLHAFVVRLVHPLTGQSIELRASPSPSMIEMLNRIDPQAKWQLCD